MFEIKLLDPRAIIPQYQTPGAAAMDLHACLPESLTIYPGDIIKFSTGIAIHINNPCVAAHILPRSGLATKHGITVINAPGLIDEDYQGEIFVSLINLSKLRYRLNHGDRIAQLEFVRIQKVKFKIVEEFSIITERGDGGFGSTGS
jgi:dUTP pyrophosphatase